MTAAFMTAVKIEIHELIEMVSGAFDSGLSWYLARITIMATRQAVAIPQLSNSKTQRSLNSSRSFENLIILEFVGKVADIGVFLAVRSSICDVGLFSSLTEELA